MDEKGGHEEQGEDLEGWLAEEKESVVRCRTPTVPMLQPHKRTFLPGLQVV